MFDRFISEIFNLGFIFEAYFKSLPLFDQKNLFTCAYERPSIEFGIFFRSLFIVTSWKITWRRVFFIRKIPNRKIVPSPEGRSQELTPNHCLIINFFYQRIFLFGSEIKNKGLL